MDAIPYLAAASSFMGLLLAWFFYTNVKAADPGDDLLAWASPLYDELRTARLVA